MVSLLLIVIVITLSLAQLALLAMLAAKGRGAGTALADAPPDRAYVRWRFVYVNPHDPRGIVPKLYGYGWTVNFRSPVWARAFVVLFAALLASVVALALQ